MRKLLLQVQISVDGFVAGPNGEMDWMTWNWDDKIKEYVSGLHTSIDTILLGRKTYEVALGFQRDGVVDSAFDPKVKNYVFTRTLKPAAAGSPPRLNGP